jgi:CBS domain-containing protein
MDERYVRDLMTRSVVTLNQNDGLATADDVMRLGRIRHIVVVATMGSSLAFSVSATSFMVGTESAWLRHASEGACSGHVGR